LFDAQQFLTVNFKTPTGLVSFLRAYGANLPADEAVRKWFQRGAVPAEWFAVLLAYLEIDRGTPVSVIDYLRVKD
jgi:hypothetical protein